MMFFRREGDVIAERVATRDEVYDILHSSSDVTIYHDGEPAVEDASYEEAVGEFSNLDNDLFSAFDIQYQWGSLCERIGGELPYEAQSVGGKEITISGTYQAADAK